MLLHCDYIRPAYSYSPRLMTPGVRHKMLISTNDKVVLILGASSGIGRAAAMLFAREGAKVVAAARRDDRLQCLREELAREQREIAVRNADVCQLRDMRHLARETLEGFGRIDIRVYAIGYQAAKRGILTPSAPDLVILAFQGSRKLRGASSPTTRSLLAPAHSLVRSAWGNL